MPTVIKILVLGFLLGVLSGCGLFKTTDDGGRIADYRKSKTLPPLEIPPDLTTSAIRTELPIPGEDRSKTTYSKYTSFNCNGRRQMQGNLASVLPKPDNIQVKQKADKRWLVIDLDSRVLWQKIHDFWVAEGFELTINNPKIGIMETEWKENRADIPEDGIRKLLKGALDLLYSADTRDKFRTRIEPTLQNNKTEVYISHRGVEEVGRGEDNTVWQRRPSDPELEAEMLNRLIVFLGTPAEEAKRLVAEAEKKPPKARLTADGKMPKLLLNQSLEQAWRVTGLVLDRLGFKIEDRNREQSFYFIQYVDPASYQEPGFFSRIFGNTAEQQREYVINLAREAEAMTEVTVLDKEKQPVTQKTAEKILTLLYEQLK